MIYGINFNGTEIPKGIKRMFAASKKFDGVAFKLDLKGIAQSIDERDSMLIQADNGHRTIRVVARQTAAGVWFGIYC